MRDRSEIERTIFHAREDLEEKLGELVHRLRDKVRVRARAEHAVAVYSRAHRDELIVAVALGAVMLATAWLFGYGRKRARKAPLLVA